MSHNKWCTCQQCTDARIDRIETLESVLKQQADMVSRDAVRAWLEAEAAKQFIHRDRNRGGNYFIRHDGMVDCCRDLAARVGEIGEGTDGN